MKILLVEDDTHLAENCKIFLEDANFLVDVCETGKKGLFKAKNNQYSVIILDWMLPDITGIEVLRELRAARIQTPVIMATARSQMEDKLEGFSIGIDDYITKPYELPELVARIQAIIRRTSTGAITNIVTCGTLKINLDSCEVFNRESRVELPPKEYAILELLALNKESVVSRDEIITHVWHEDVNLFTNHVEVHLKNLRQKLERPFNTSYIRTVKGKGYLLTEKNNGTSN